LQFVVVSPVWGLELGPIYLATLWAIGFSMIVLAGLVFVPPRAVLLTGVLNLLGHNLFDPVHASAFGNLAPLWTIVLHNNSFSNFDRVYCGFRFRRKTWAVLITGGSHSMTWGGSFHLSYRWAR
jgi:hypothetical protein